MMTAVQAEKAKKKRVGSLKREKIFTTIFGHLLLVILAIIWLYPIVWIVLQSFRVEYTDGQLVGIVVSHYFPKGLGLENYKNLFSHPTFPFGR